MDLAETNEDVLGHVGRSVRLPRSPVRQRFFDPACLKSPTLLDEGGKRHLDIAKWPFFLI
jgi:hypothetical protein